MYPDSEVYLIPARLDECEPPKDRLRDLHWVDLFPDWDAGVAKLRSSFVLDPPDTDTFLHERSLAIIVEKIRDSRLLHTGKIPGAEICFSIKNVSDNPVSVYDLGLEDVDVKGGAVPCPHMMSCRVKLDVELARPGAQGETIHLFSAACHECYDLQKERKQSAVSSGGLAGLFRAFTIDMEDPDAGLNVHRDTVAFHSIIGPDKILNLAPSEADSFVLTTIHHTGCAQIRTAFKITALYHDRDGVKRRASSREAFVVQSDDRNTEVRITTGDDKVVP